MTMVREPVLFDHPPEPPFVKGSDTSQEAARRIASETGTLRAKVLAYLRRAGSYGATDEEMQKGLMMSPSTQRPRRGELQKAGLIQQSTALRFTQSGRRAIVWV